MKKCETCLQKKDIDEIVLFKGNCLECHYDLTMEGESNE